MQCSAFSSIKLQLVEHWSLNNAFFTNFYGKKKSPTVHIAVTARKWVPGQHMHEKFYKYLGKDAQTLTVA